VPSFFLSSYKIGLISYSFISFSPLLALSFFFTTSAREGNEALDSAGAGGLRQRAERPENLHGITERERGAYLQLTEVLRPLFHSPHFSFPPPHQEALMPDIMAMVKANICRALPPNNEDFDPEEDEPILENSWPHLQVCA
jgi:hypothetical protein